MPERDAEPPDAEPAEDWQTREIAAPKIPKGVRKRQEEPWPIAWIVGSLGLGLVLILLGYYAAANGFFDQFLQEDATPSPNAFFIPSPRASELDGETPEPTPTRAIVVVPRDPSDLLDTPYTPTPLYVNTPHPDSPYEDGIAAMAAQNFEEAILAFEEHLVANPGDADAAYYRAEAYYRLEDYQAAYDGYNQAITINSQLAPAYLGRAQSGAELGVPDSDRLTDLNTALLLDSNFGLGYIGRADYHLERDETTPALQALATAEALLPDSALMHNRKAEAQLQDENYSAALVSAQRAYNIDITYLDNYLTLAEAQQANGNYFGSIETLQRYLSFEGDSGEAWELLGVSYFLNGNSSPSQEAFDRALEIDPNLPTASYYKGLDEESKGNNQAALGYFRTAVTGRPDWFEARIALARAYLMGGNPGNAFLEANASSSLIETNEQRAALYYWRATILESLGQSGTALADWQALLALPVDDVPSDWRQAAEAKANP
jgi:tetratricopeptide (TPR) repeat protein